MAPQAPLSVGFPRQEYWSGLPFPSLGDLAEPGIEPVSPASPALLADSLLLSQQGSARMSDLTLRQPFRDKTFPLRCTWLKTGAGRLNNLLKSPAGQGLNCSWEIKKKKKKACYKTVQFFTLLS